MDESLFKLVKSRFDVKIFFLCFFFIKPRFRARGNSVLLISNRSSKTQHQQRSLRKITLFFSSIMLFLAKHSLIKHNQFQARTSPPGNPWGFAPIFSPGPGDLYHLNCPGTAPGVGPII